MLADLKDTLAEIATASDSLISNILKTCEEVHQFNAHQTQLHLSIATLANQLQQLQNNAKDVQQIKSDLDNDKMVAEPFQYYL